MAEEHEYKKIGLIAKQGSKYLLDAVQSYEKLQESRHKIGLGRSRKLDERMEVMRELAGKIDRGEHSPSKTVLVLISAAKLLSIPGFLLGAGVVIVSVVDRFIPITQVLNQKGVLKLGTISYGFLTTALALVLVKVQSIALKQFINLTMLYYAGRVQKREMEAGVMKISKDSSSKVSRVVDKLVTIFNRSKNKGSKDVEKSK